MLMLPPTMSLRHAAFELLITLLIDSFDAAMIRCDTSPAYYVIML